MSCIHRRAACATLLLLIFLFNCAGICILVFFLGFFNVRHFGLTLDCGSPVPLCFTATCSVITKVAEDTKNLSYPTPGRIQSGSGLPQSKDSLRSSINIKLHSRQTRHASAFAKMLPTSLGSCEGQDGGQESRATSSQSSDGTGPTW